MSSSPLFTVLICTYNRADSLPRTLHAVRDLDANGFDYEVIVVDNNSTDATPRLLAERAIKWPGLRSLHEPRQGKSFALNTGIASARGEIIAFTDDDVRPAKDWLERLREIYNGYHAAAVGGRVVLDGNKRLPKWLHPDLRLFLGLKDMGDEVTVVRPPEALVGANMSARTSVARRVGFRIDLGPRGRNPSVAYNEDSDFCFRVQELKECGEVLYTPHAVTYHAMMPEKLTRRFFRQRARGEGKATARLSPTQSKPQLAYRTLALSFRSLFAGLGWLKRVGKPDEQFLREFRLIHEWSALFYMWKSVWNQ